MILTFGEEDRGEKDGSRDVVETSFGVLSNVFRVDGHHKLTGTSYLKYDDLIDLGDGE